MMKCKRCKCEIERKTNNQKYCEECAIIIKRDMDKYRMRYKRNIGATHEDYCREIKRIGFKRQFS